MIFNHWSLFFNQLFFFNYDQSQVFLSYWRPILIFLSLSIDLFTSTSKINSLNFYFLVHPREYFLFNCRVWILTRALHENTTHSIVEWNSWKIRFLYNLCICCGRNLEETQIIQGKWRQNSSSTLLYYRDNSQARKA